jgi:hypothetical protein
LQGIFYFKLAKSLQTVIVRLSAKENPQKLFIVKTISEDKNNTVSKGETLSLKVPDDEFAELFNHALKATGASRARLMTVAVREGVGTAVAILSEGREQALKSFQQLMIKRGEKSAALYNISTLFTILSSMTSLVPLHHICPLINWPAT